MRPIITSLLDTDFYKFSMGQCYLHRFPNEQARWEFKSRTKGVKLGYLKPEIDEQLDYLCQLKLTQDELDYLSTIPWLSKDYIEWLEDLQLKRKYITVTDNDGELEIVAEGPQLKVFWFEIFVLEIVQQLYMEEQEIDISVAKKNLQDTIDKFNAATDAGIKFTLADFGARRRYSKLWQYKVVKEFAKQCKAFVGTSNVWLAKEFGIKPIGTFAHEMYAIAQGLENVPVRQAQKAVLDAWTQEYRGDLGIALSDNFGFNAFLKDFDKFYAKLFDGCRHDSGDPYKWGDMLIAHYKKLGIDPMTKTGCWSDSLDVDKAIDIAKYFNDKIKVSFGIGTFLTNNVGGKPLSMVMKVVETNGKPVVKLSDAPGKIMCKDEDYINYVKKVYEYKSIDEE